MDGLLVSVLAGAVGGILVTLGERFLFAGPEAVRGVKRSFRFYWQQYGVGKGRRGIRCPVCLRAKPDRVVDLSVLPEGWENAPADIAWFRCPECTEVWGLRTVITAFRPVPGKDRK